MRQFHLRIYSLDSAEALEQYATQNYPRHLESFPKHGIRPEGFFKLADGADPKLYVLVSYDEGADGDAVSAGYMASPDLLADLEGFDPSHILNVDDITLIPTPGSPLT
ncbi:MAG: NIPSNAP family protein [Brevundimonas sp.]|uniref:NIPSNAP family protein n=1 Tax=Brevundimonas sp. TaxID=1871086 RepID=UPI00271917E3|nr:NIPSNAP family protein [Brevundimonas sp.]MDO9607659.1 NIPSNAP family protein [Brevundimonas sp.]